MFSPDKCALWKARKIYQCEGSRGEKRVVSFSQVKFWYSDWGVISWASWSVLWNLASSNKHYHHASQGRALLIVSLSHYENERLRTIAPSSHDKDLCYSIVCQGFSFATSVWFCVSCVCAHRPIHVWSLPYVSWLESYKVKTGVASRKAVRLINWV